MQRFVDEAVGRLRATYEKYPYTRDLVNQIGLDEGPILGEPEPTLNPAAQAVQHTQQERAESGNEAYNFPRRQTSTYGYGDGGYGGYGYGYGGGGSRAMNEYQQRQIELERERLQISREQLAQEKELEEKRLAEEERLRQAEIAQRQREADANTVNAFTRELMGLQGPKDPYGYLFHSRGLAAPQGYKPEPLPLAQPIQDMYKQQGIDLAEAQKGLVGEAGPSYIEGYLGGHSQALQQGPMGFQNTPAFGGLAPGSEESKTAQEQLSKNPAEPSSGIPEAAGGGVFPGFAPGNDSILAKVSPGEGVLTPQTVQAIGGPPAISALNQMGNTNTYNPLWSAGPTGPSGMPRPPSQNQIRQASIPQFQGGGTVAPEDVGTYRYDPIYNQEPVYANYGQGNFGGTVWLHDQPSYESPVGYQMPAWQSMSLWPGMPGAVAGSYYNSPYGGGSNQWIPLNVDNRLMYGFAPEVSVTNRPTGESRQVQAGTTPVKTGSKYMLAGQEVGQGTRENAPPPGSTWISPGVAQLPPNWVGLTEQALGGRLGIPYSTKAAGGLLGPQPAERQGPVPEGGTVPTFQTGGTVSQPQTYGQSYAPKDISSYIPPGSLGAPVMGPTGISNPVQGGPPANMFNPSAPYLTGGVLKMPPPPTGPPINLNMLDPATRALVNEYGVPQIPSAQAWGAMTPSEQDAYKSYVGKVAGGRAEDLLSIQKQIFNRPGSEFNPEGVTFT